jgi:hypothetical protein
MLYLPSAYETMSAASKQINSLNDIMLFVDKSAMSQQEKEKTKYKIGPQLKN